MRIAFLTNEYPPNIYGGAGVHAEYLSRELACLEGGHQVDVICFGQQNEEGSPSVRGVSSRFDYPAQDERHQKVFDSLHKNLFMAGSAHKPDIVHCHTWYTHFAGCLLQELWQAPLVLTTHSLEPHRPWKEEQLGRGYQVSTWVERTAYQNAAGVVAVSQSMSRDVQNLYGVHSDRVRIIPNGIDPEEYRPVRDETWLRSLGIDPQKPIALFVGRITRQKGIIHLVEAIPRLSPEIQVILVAGSPDTPEIGREMETKVKECRQICPHRIVWIPGMLPRPRIIQLYTMATVFVCPSVYEPFGIINLESMACETPVVASRVGGIPEVVAHGKTGLLVDLELKMNGHAAPAEPEKFSQNLAAAVNELVASPGKLEAMGKKARQTVEERFSWRSVAARTLEFYRDLCAYRG